MKLAVKYSRHGEEYWVGGYELFNPELWHEVNPGRGGKLTVYRRNHIAVVREGQRGKPICRPCAVVKEVDDYVGLYSFCEVFGSVNVPGTHA